jgi:hypothetical protein
VPTQTNSPCQHFERFAGQPLGGAGRTLLLPHPCGVKVGLMGLVEGDWVETLSTIEPEDVK